MNAQFTVIEVVTHQQDEDELPAQLFYFAPWWQWNFLHTHFHTIAQVRLPREITPQEEQLLDEAEHEPEIDSIRYATHEWEGEAS